MRRRRAAGVLVLALFCAAGVVLLARWVLLRRASPELLAAWLTRQTAQSGMVLTVGEVTAPEAGRLHLTSLTLEPQGAVPGTPGATLRAHGVDVTYRVPLLSVRSVVVQHVHVDRGMMTWPAASQEDAASVWSSVSLAVSAHLAETVATAFAGGSVSVDRMDIALHVMDGPPPRVVGEEWHLAVGPRGRTIAVHGRVRTDAEPRAELEIQAEWAREHGWNLTARGAAADLAHEWQWWRRIVPRAAELPLRWEGGRGEWHVRLAGLGRANWTAEGTVTFADVALPVADAAITPWAGTTVWRLRRAPTARGVLVESFDLQSNHGDLTLDGTVTGSEGPATLELRLILLGIRGALLRDGLVALTQRTQTAILGLTIAPDAEAMVELAVQGTTAAPRVTGKVDLAGAPFQVEMSPDSPYVQFAELRGHQARFLYDPVADAVHGRLDLDEGTLELGVLDLVGHDVRGTLCFGPTGLQLGPAPAGQSALGPLAGADAAPIRARLAGAEVEVWGVLPTAEAEPIHLQLEAGISDPQQFVAPLAFSDAVKLAIPSASGGGAGSARVSGSVKGRPPLLETSVVVDFTPVEVRVGQVVDKPAGSRALVSGVFRRRNEGLRGDLRFTLADTVMERDVRLDGALVLTPRQDVPAPGSSAGPFSAWDLTAGITVDAIGLDVLRRVSPITRLLRGYGVAQFSFLYETGTGEPISYAWLETEHVTVQLPESGRRYELAHSIWSAKSYPDRRVTQLDVSGDLCTILEPLASGLSPEAPDLAAVESPGSPWKTLVAFDFDRAAWEDRVQGEALRGWLTSQAGNTRVAPLQVQVFDGEVDAEIAVDRDGETTVSATWRDCDVHEILVARYGISGAAHGRTHGSCTFSGARGAWPRWQGEGSLRVDTPSVAARYFTDEEADLPWSTLRADLATTRFTYQNGRFTLPDLRVERPGMIIRAHGNIDLEGDLRIKCFAQVDNDLIEQLPLLTRAMFTRPDSPDTREVEFTLRHNIRDLRPKVKRSSVGFVLGDLGRGGMSRSGQLLLDLLGL